MSTINKLDTNPKSWGPGVWFTLFSDALRSRTPETIQEFIKRAIPILTSLLCEVCSVEAFKLISNRHPINYYDIYDSRHENIGMYLWIFDLHNDVNKRLEKPVYSLEQVNAMYAPLLQLTSNQILSDRVAAMLPDTMSDLFTVTFNNNEEIIVQKEKPRVPLLVKQRLIPKKTVKPKCDSCDDHNKALNTTNNKL